MVGYAVVTILALAVSTGWGISWTAGSVDAQIPLFVYLYGLLGGMTCAFTSIVAKFERGLRGILRVGIRALAALPLAAGVYLLDGPVGVPIDHVRVAAGLSFLVGLYVNVALKGLGGLADRLFGTVARESDDQAATGRSPADTAVTAADVEGPPRSPGASETD